MGHQTDAVCGPYVDTMASEWAVGSSFVIIIIIKLSNLQLLSLFLLPFINDSMMLLLLLISILSLPVHSFAPTRTLCRRPSKFELKATTDVEIYFSHIQLYADSIGSVSEYKDLENALNSLSLYSSPKSLSEKRELWRSTYPSSDSSAPFVPQNRDVVKQLLVGFGFRVTGCRLPEGNDKTNTRSLLVTSKDPNGVQIVVTAIDEDSENPSDNYQHFDAGEKD